MVTNERLLKRRKEMNMTQKEVARAVGISQAYYSEIETGRRMPRIPVAVKIARVLMTGMDALFTGN